MIASSTDILNQLRGTLEKMEVALGAICEAIVWTNQAGCVQWSNPAFHQLMGQQPVSLGAKLTDLLPLVQNETIVVPEAHPVNLALRDHTNAVGVYAFYRANQRLVVEVSWSYIQLHEGEASAVLAIRDITMRQTVENELRESEERYMLATQGANDGLWDWKLKTGKIYFSSKWKSILGYEDTEIGDSPDEWFDRIHPDDSKQVKWDLVKHFKGLSTHFQSEHRLRHRDGSYRWILIRGLAVRDATGKVHRMAGSQTDMSDRKRVEQQLVYDAFHDALTGLPNRALFKDRLEHAVKLAQRRPDYFFAVLLLDLDRFKVINDSLGHLAGDQVLIEVAKRLESSLRSGDTVARLGGDEFVILLEGIQASADATEIADRIKQHLATPFNLNGQEVFISVSIGIRLCRTVCEQPDELLRDADTALYQAKIMGKARHAIFDKSMHVQAVTLLQLQNDLRRAIQRQEIFLHYQPIVSLRTERLAGFEALVRWRHPDYGLISPSDFIPVAEDTGIILEIGEWVLQEACRQMRSWQECYPSESPLTISVNLSSKQLAQVQLIQQIEAILRDTNFDSQYLRLEITESSILEKPEFAIEMLQQLQKRGIRLSIDDFGTGYSSLSYLHRLPIDTLKIDRSFVNKMDTELTKLELVRAIIALAWNLGIDTVAEGIETSKQLAQLRSLNCDFGQGYYFSKPLDEQAIAAHLSRAVTARFTA